MKTLNELLTTTSYGQYDITTQEARDILEENGYTVIENDNDMNTAGYEYIGEGFFGMDDSMIGKTAYARYARPIIYNIYRKKENFKKIKEEEINEIEEKEEKKYQEEKNERKNLENGETKIELEVEEMKRGYSLGIKTENFKKYGIKQKFVKILEENTGLAREELCRYIEKNYTGITLNLKLDGKFYKIEDRNYEYF